MVSLVVETAAPEDTLPLPRLPSALMAALRAELLLAAAAAVALVAAGALAPPELAALTVPSGRFGRAVPAAPPPAGGAEISASAAGGCGEGGEVSITT